MTTLRNLAPDRVRQILDDGGLGIDLRPTDDYLARQAPGTLPLLYEAGPGLGGPAAELQPPGAIGVLAGWGVWAAAAVGILEKLGFRKITFVRTRRPGEKPPQAEPVVFRAGGPP